MNISFSSQVSFDLFQDADLNYCISIQTIWNFVSTLSRLNHIVEMDRATSMLKLLQFFDFAETSHPGKHC